ncbi:hypothetical protein [Brachyspira catarrhinii]|uniref:hypothetical protein n=1 Tax=Brachyspira catarrhinii TaxID=2528966 RepID=UPI001F382DBB|nr:hypothetical protein [Brachyspira catarrhinii]
MKKNINFEYSLIIYLITALTVSISVLYSIGSKSNILNLLIIAFGIASYIAVSNIVKIAIINFTVFIFSKNNDKNNLKIFACNCFGIYGIFIFILPITLIFSNIIIQFLAFFVIQIYYLVLLYRNIKFSFDIDNSFKAFIILLSPIIFDYLSYITLGILVFGVFINIL